MIFNGKRIFEESPDAADDYRRRYVEGCSKFIKRKNLEGKRIRKEFISPEKLAENREKYREEYKRMLGLDKFGNCKKAALRKYIGSDDVCNIYRLTVYPAEEIPFYCLLSVPFGAHNAPLFIAQHGGGGTPELCSDMVGNNNYNHLAQRALARGAVVLAPQLMLWSTEENETMRAHDIPHDRRALDNSLKRFGMSITALEIVGIMKGIDYVTSLNEVDAERIVMAGISYGGYFTMHTMAADTRIKAGYSAAVFNDRDVYDWSDWCYNESALKFQDAEVAALCAPRGLYIQVGKADTVFNYSSAVAEARKVEDYFAVQSAEDNFKFSLWDGGHTIPDSDEGFDFIFSAI